MKKPYKSADIEVFLFDTCETIVASGMTEATDPSYTPEENEMEIL